MPPYIIEIFSYEWFYTNILSISLIIFFLIGLSLVKSNIIKEKRSQELLTKTIGILILLRFIFSQSYQVSNGLWNVSHSLPLHLCGISGIISGVVLIRYNQSLYEFVLLLGLPGAVWSFLTPQINVYEPGMLFENPGYMYFDYFISHAAIIFAPLYLTFIMNKKPRTSSWYKIFVKSNLILIPIVSVANVCIFYLLSVQDVNYMYLMYPPGADNPFIVGGWPWYILIIEFVCLIHVCIIYSAFFVRNKTINYFLLKKGVT